jgi:transmembrane sensor
LGDRLPPIALLPQMDKESFILLSSRVADGKATEAEIALYSHYFDNLQLSSEWDEELMGNREETRLAIFEKIIAGRKAPVRKMLWFRVAAAAAVVLFVVAGSYLLVQDKKETQAPVLADIAAPATNRATIVLSDGSSIYLDSTQNGMLVTGGNTNIVKLADGKIAYGNTATAGETVYNTLINPRGSKVIDMLLSDGSHVWLNAGSSIRFPVTFSGNKREVELDGEAYFEVVHDAKQPFIVSTNKGQTVEDIGTSFNVSSYGDEPAAKISLIEGVVKVDGRLLKPGEAWLGGKVIATDTEADIAWKNGRMVFHDADAAMVLRGIERWYDIKVEIKGSLPEKAFYFEVSRSAKLSALLRVLENNNLHISMDSQNKTITVNP